MQAASYLGVPPWELEKQPVYWRDMALAMMAATETASDAQRKR